MCELFCKGVVLKVVSRGKAKGNTRVLGFSSAFRLLLNENFPDPMQKVTCSIVVRKVKYNQTGRQSTRSPLGCCLKKPTRGSGPIANSQMHPKRFCVYMGGAPAISLWFLFIQPQRVTLNNTRPITHACLPPAMVMAP